ncbi:hypothetical protein ACFL5H_03350 [Candidatus Latescibacterota bacterium]
MGIKKEWSLIIKGGIMRIHRLWIEVLILGLVTVFSCSDSTSSKDSDTINNGLIGKWLEYDSTYTEFYNDGIMIQNDGNIWDLMIVNEEWDIDAEDLEGTFTNADNGTFNMTWKEEGSNESVGGSYILQNDKLTLIYNFTSGQVTHYYLRISD